MKQSQNDFVVLLHEVKYHPNSYLTKLYKMFEVTSIVNITKKEELKKYRKRPIFEDKYLITFETVKTFDDNKAFINFDSMFIVVCCENKSQVEDAKMACQTGDIPYKIYENAFSKENAFSLMRTYTPKLSDNFCTAVVRQVGLNPLRIMTAMSVCEQLGYKVSVVQRYIDKWIYSDIRKLIGCLLGVPEHKSDLNNAYLYLHLNRHWYKYVQKNIVDELDQILEIYEDKLSGKLSLENLFDYVDSNNVSRNKVSYALRLFERCDITAVYSMREFIKLASMLDLVLLLQGG